MLVVVVVVVRYTRMVRVAGLTCCAVLRNIVVRMCTRVLGVGTGVCLEFARIMQICAVRSIRGVAGPRGRQRRGRVDQEPDKRQDDDPCQQGRLEGMMVRGRTQANSLRRMCYLKKSEHRRFTSGEG